MNAELKKRIITSLFLLIVCLYVFLYILFLIINFIAIISWIEFYAV